MAIVREKIYKIIIYSSTNYSIITNFWLDNNFIFFFSELPPNVFFLMCIFLPLNFLAATQDIAVDGWALTMLSRKNVGYAST